MTHRHLCTYVHCGKEFDSAKYLRACSGCKRVRYCRQDCQRQDWKVHKTNCRLHEATLSSVELASQRGIMTPDGLDPAKLGVDLRKWSERHTLWKADVAAQALNIWRSDSNWKTHAVHVKLDVHDVSPESASDDTPYVFTLATADLVPLDAIKEVAAMRGGMPVERYLRTYEEQESSLLIGADGEKKFARFVMLVITASDQSMFCPQAISEEEMEYPPSEDVHWEDRARLSLQLPSSINLLKATKLLRHPWASKQQEALSFIAVNCLNLKQTPTQNSSHLVEIEIFVGKIPGGGGYNFTPLKAIAKPFSEYHARYRDLEETERLPMDAFREELTIAESHCQLPDRIPGGKTLIISLIIVKASVLVPIFVPDDVIAATESRVDWQEHKYRLIVK